MVCITLKNHLCLSQTEHLCLLQTEHLCLSQTQHLCLSQTEHLCLSQAEHLCLSQAGAFILKTWAKTNIPMPEVSNQLLNQRVKTLFKETKKIPLLCHRNDDQLLATSFLKNKQLNYLSGFMKRFDKSLSKHYHQQSTHSYDHSIANIAKTTNQKGLSHLHPSIQKKTPLSHSHSYHGMRPL